MLTVQLAAFGRCDEGGMAPNIAAARVHLSMSVGA
jgi:hypothetical protein